MSGWQDSDSDKENSSDRDDFQPAKKRKTMKLSKSGKERFSGTVSEEQLAVLLKGFVPKNTSKNTQWVVNTFEAWVKSRKRRAKDSIDQDVLRCTPVDKKELCRCLSLFIAEAKERRKSVPS